MVGCRGGSWYVYGCLGYPYLKIGKNNLCVFCIFFGNLHGRFVQTIGLKVLGDYLDQFWYNKMSVLLCEGPKPPNSMISGFVSPGEPLFMDLNISKYFKQYKKDMEVFFKRGMFYKLHNCGNPKFIIVCPDLEKTGTGQ